MKRISFHIAAIYEALFEDFRMWGYGNPREYERDLSRIVTLIETRGERVVTIDFPAYGKLFDFAISRGLLMPGMFPLLGKRKEIIPRFMESQFALVFDIDGTLRADAHPGVVSNIRQVFRCFQKVVIPCGELYVKEAINAFFATDKALRSVSDGWYSGVFSDTVALSDALISGSSQGTLFPDIGSKVCSRALVSLAQRVADVITAQFAFLDPDSIVGNHGPGAVSDSPFREDKYTFPTWNQRLSRVFPFDYHAYANTRISAEVGAYVDDRMESQREAPAKLIPVPKSQDKPRLIASEPTANQFIQGGINKFLRDEIRRSSIGISLHLEDQTVSQAMALQASNDSSLATVDLKDASDRLSCWTIERIFRKRVDILAAFAASRSAYLTDNVTQTNAMLRKYAPQGNATTFPTQSIVYAVLAIASTMYGGPGKIARSSRAFLKQLETAATKVVVFGDDIIIPTYALPFLSSLLELCQLKVNGAKSHYSGNFAESCGMDAFHIWDVTPAYVRIIGDTATPDGVASTVEVSNNFFRKGLFHTARVVESWIPPKYLRDIPVTRDSGNYSLALHTFNSGTAASRFRYNSDLYRDEVLVLVLETRVKRVRRDEWSSLYQYFIEAPMALDNSGSQDLENYSQVPWSSGYNKDVRQRLRRKWVSVSR